MRESKFIEQNREKWSEFEGMLRDKNRDPEKLNELFIQVLDDLSYARTFYPNRSVRMYLNGLAQQAFHQVYRGNRFPLQRFWLFWTEELPQVMWEARKALWLSFSIFALACLIGVVSSIINPDFARVILGEDYVDMTLRNIEHGDPMAVYKESKPLGMAAGIAVNNIFVALRTAFFGIVSSIGTVFILLYNGVMLGAFQYFFVERGLFRDSFLTIWIHGTLEISAIIIAGAAGLVAGSGWLFPGTYTRLQAFRFSMRRGLKIFLGLIPVFLLAAFFEGFLTRYTDTPALIRGMFIASCLFAVLGYFVWLPWHLARSGFRKPLLEKEPPVTLAERIGFSEIKNAGGFLSDAFLLLRRQPALIWSGLIAASAVYLAVAFRLNHLQVTELFSGVSYPGFTFQAWWDAMDRKGMPVLFWGQVVLCWGLFWLVIIAIRREMPPEQAGKQRSSFFDLNQVIIFGVSFLFFWLIDSIETGSLLWLAGVLLFPFLSLWAVVACFEGPVWQSIPRAWVLAHWGQGLLFGFVIVNLGLLVFLLFDSMIWSDGVLPVFNWLVPEQAGSVQDYRIACTAFAGNLVAYLVWVFFIAGGVSHYFSSREIADAASLQEGIAQVGVSRQIRGLARE